MAGSRFTASDSCWHGPRGLALHVKLEFYASAQCLCLIFRWRSGGWCWLVVVNYRNSFEEEHFCKWRFNAPEQLLGTVPQAFTATDQRIAALSGLQILPQLCKQLIPDQEASLCPNTTFTCTVENRHPLFFMAPGEQSGYKRTFCPQKLLLEVGKGTSVRIQPSLCQNQYCLFLLHFLLF